MDLLYHSDEKGQITRINEDTITYQNMQFGTKFFTFPTIGNGYCIITINSTAVSNLPSDSIDPQLFVYATCVQADVEKATVPYLIYHHTQIPSLQIEDIACGTSFIGVGYSCFLEITTNVSGFKRSILKINFLSSG